ncbi:hypothetical protein J3B02_002108 [Coemansia erecta]|uniref:Copper acquisition factor BIM1-like domain-containing protein n=1 Tax=Coemansia asiatica TaxID=1052880 RepID=A0A9W7XMR6_9FUNG|nr:hypothetical protein LPJ64_000609 [Coemansia asiatica]KAJ2855537.1 hypothetical protein J3B02_002108 [Coemansia erecta]
MVKIFASAAVTAFALVQSACAHMAVISPPPRSGIIGNELLKPCGGGNQVVDRNITTFAVDSTSNFVLRPSHGTGNLIFNYFTDLDVTNSSKAYPLDDVPISKPDTYTVPIDFAKAGLKDGQHIVVQAIYNGTDDGETEQYYVCFDVKLGEVESAGSDSENHSDSEDELDSVESTKSGSIKSASVSAKAVLGAAAGLAIAAFAF